MELCDLAEEGRTSEWNTDKIEEYAEKRLNGSRPMAKAENEAQIQESEMTPSTAPKKRRTISETPQKSSVKSFFGPPSAICQQRHGRWLLDRFVFTAFLTRQRSVLRGQLKVDLEAYPEAAFHAGRD